MDFDDQYIEDEFKIQWRNPTKDGVQISLFVFGTFGTSFLATSFNNQPDTWLDQPPFNRLWPQVSIVMLSVSILIGVSSRLSWC